MKSCGRSVGPGCGEAPRPSAVCSQPVRPVGLRGHGRSRSSGRGLGVPEIGGRAHAEIILEPHAVRDARRDLEAGDLVVRYGLQVLAQGPDAVAVGGHEDRSPQLRGPTQVGHDGGLEVGDRPPHHVGEALRAREVGRMEVTVAGVTRHVVGMARSQGRRRRVVAPAPRRELGLAELLLDLGLVLPLQVPVVTLVQAPVPADREPAAAGRRQGDLGRADGAGEDRGVQHAEVQVLLGGQELAPARASASPAGVRSTSTHPVNRFSAFHSDSPWRSRTRSSTARS